MPRYSETLVDHVLAPRNAGQMDEPTAVGMSSLAGRAPYTVLFIKVDANVVQEARFQTFGCGVSIAACSALTEIVTGKSLQECLHVKPLDVIEELDGVPAEKQFCADLAIGALRNAIESLEEEKRT